jgi:predicted MFS family arabinose efflux permease
MIGDSYGWRASFVLVAALSAVAAVAVGVLLPSLQGASAAANLESGLAVAKRPAVLVAASITALGVAAGFVVLTYVRPLLESLTGFGGTGIGWLLLLFGLASVAGTALGGFAADRFGYGRIAAPILIMLTLSLLSFSLVFAIEAGSLYAVFGAGAALVVWSLVGFALIPLQQYRLIDVAPEDENEALSLNASAIYIGQGFGSWLGSLVLGYASLSSLGWMGAYARRRPCFCWRSAVVPARRSLRRRTERPLTDPFLSEIEISSYPTTSRSCPGMVTART